MVAELYEAEKISDVSVLPIAKNTKIMAIEMTASTIIKSHRKDVLDLTQEEFANKCGVSKKTIENIEKGVRVRKTTLSKVLAVSGYQIIEKIEKIK